jgi:RimJ/RimL family protein N-acetyltransferase
MPGPPIIATKRLILRPFAEADAQWVHAHAGAREIARTTQNIPHPYEPGMAERWIATHGPGWDAGNLLASAIARKDDGELVGAVGLTIEREDERAELGYWIAVPWWGHGYATEAAAALVGYGFEQLHLHRIVARHFGSNPASGRVMQKVGMVQEGVLREHFVKWGEWEDIIVYGVLARDYVHR